MLPPLSCENVHLQRSWGKGGTSCVGGEGAPQGLAAALGRDLWGLPCVGSGNAGERSKAHRGPGEVNGGILFHHPTDTLLNPAACSVGPTQPIFS